MDPYKIYFEHSGIYLFTTNIEINTNGQENFAVDFWYRLNGQDVNNSSINYTYSQVLLNNNILPINNSFVIKKKI